MLLLLLPAGLAGWRRRRGPVGAPGMTRASGARHLKIGITGYPGLPQYASVPLSKRDRPAVKRR